VPRTVLLGKGPELWLGNQRFQRAQNLGLDRRVCLQTEFHVPVRGETEPPFSAGRRPEEPYSGNAKEIRCMEHAGINAQKEIRFRH
jgi:hypothetical protein